MFIHLSFSFESDAILLDPVKFEIDDSDNDGDDVGIEVTLIEEDMVRGLLEKD